MSTFTKMYYNGPISVVFGVWCCWYADFSTRQWFTNVNFSTPTNQGDEVWKSWIWFCGNNLHILCFLQPRHLSNSSQHYHHNRRFCRKGQIGRRLTLIIRESLSWSSTSWSPSAPFGVGRPFNALLGWSQGNSGSSKGNNALADHCAQHTALDRTTSHISGVML